MKFSRIFLKTFSSVDVPHIIRLWHKVDAQYNSRKHKAVLRTYRKVSSSSSCSEAPFSFKSRVSALMFYYNFHIIKVYRTLFSTYVNFPPQKYLFFSFIAFNIVSCPELQLSANKFNHNSNTYMCEDILWWLWHLWNTPCRWNTWYMVPVQKD